jgi:DNA polymerase-3 subunit epsilon
MRQVILDTETTGIGHDKGHRIIEIGCLELVDRQLTKAHFHVYLNPQRGVDAGAFRVHGISTEFLRDKPLFKDVVHDFLEFITGAELIIHNAPFDIGFLNAELQYLKWPKNMADYCTVEDTLVLAKQKHPGQRNSLDALCKRYGVDNTNRELHGALLDANLLAQVYLAMTGGQGDLFAETEFVVHQAAESSHAKSSPALKNPIVIEATPEELALHKAFVEKIGKKAGVTYWEDRVEAESETS